jgi:hypothetical protein
LWQRGWVRGINEFDLNELNIATWLENCVEIREYFGPLGQLQAPDKKPLMDDIE